MHTQTGELLKRAQHQQQHQRHSRHGQQCQRDHPHEAVLCAGAMQRGRQPLRIDAARLAHPLRQRPEPSVVKADDPVVAVDGAGETLQSVQSDHDQPSTESRGRQRGDHVGVHPIQSQGRIGVRPKQTRQQIRIKHVSALVTERHLIGMRTHVAIHAQAIPLHGSVHGRDQHIRTHHNRMSLLYTAHQRIQRSGGTLLRYIGQR